MGGSRVQVNKLHKSRFSSKSSRNVHKVSQKDKNRIAKSDRNVTKGAQAARLQRSKMLREQKRAALLKEKKASSGSASPPRVIVLQAPHGDLSSCMEMAKVADLIAFVASATEESTSDYIDSFGSQCLSVFRSLGLPSTVVLIRDLPTELKRRNDAKKICTSSLTSEFPRGL